MPKTATATTTKTARKEASKPAKEDKPKRPPSAYNTFMAKQLPIYKSENPSVGHKDAFTAVAALWKTSDDNPNKGKSKAEKENKPKKEKASKKKAPAKEATESSGAENEDDE